MEWKNSIHKNTGRLVINGLKEKRSWFLVSFLILFITVIIIPIITGSRIQDGHIVVGMVEIFFLVFINSMIDFSYMHDGRKLAYSISKPITDLQKINVTIITNVVFTAVLVAVLFVTSMFIKTSYMDINEIFILTVPWLITGILTAAISGILTGNSIAASLATIINFTLPLSFLAIINYFFRIIEDIAIGFNSSILFNTFIENYYRIDILYFVKYIEDGFDFTYFIVLATVLVILYGLVYVLAKRRKHERAGELVVSDGYKSFISIIIASLVPIGFSSIFYNVGFSGRIVTFIILFALAYYLINAILEKSFRLSRLAIKLFAGFMIFFALFIIIADFATNQFEGRLPVASEISSVYIGSNTWIYAQETDEGEFDSRQIYSATEEFMKKADNVILYEDQKTIQAIIDVHREVIKNQDYYYNMSFVIAYYYNDGEVLYRYYNLLEKSDYDGQKDTFVKELMNTDDFKLKRMPFVYDDHYLTGLEKPTVSINYEGENSKFIPQNTTDELDIEIFRANLKKDFDQYLMESDKSLNFLIQSPNDYYFMEPYGRDKAIMTEPYVMEEAYYVELSFNEESMKSKNYFSLRVTKAFPETFEYIASLMD
ncbi:MAG: hypothetical protein XD91_0015 [Clostridiales bacterium 38_11]|nr:MAG: hypothetical protein XD91_0015 [Clostridiales bacterium 38_11]HBH13743.1 hypothetical protein [Clostridiales bacterium]